MKQLYFPDLPLIEFDTINKHIVIDKESSDLAKKEIEYYQKYLNELDAANTKDIKLVHEIVCLLKRKYKLQQEVRSLVVFKAESYKVRGKPQKIGFIIAKGFAEDCIIDIKQRELVSIADRLKFCFWEFEKRHPAQLLILDTNFKNVLSENCAN